MDGPGIDAEIKLMYTPRNFFVINVQNKKNIIFNLSHIQNFCIQNKPRVLI